MSSSEPSPETSFSTIDVVGRGTWRAAPEVMHARLGAGLTRSSIQAAWADVATQISAVLAALTASGVAPGDLVTERLSAHPEHDHRGSSPRVVGYRVEQVVRATIRDVARGGEVVEAAMVAAGDAALMHGIEFAVEETAALADEARQVAWADAVHQAHQLAELAGLRLGPALAIAPAGSAGAPTPKLSRMAMAADMPIASGQVDGGVALAVRFRVDP